MEKTAGRATAEKIHAIAGLAIFTAIVVVLQLLGSFIRFGPFSVSLVLVPIVIGAALYGPAAGAWLGFVFGFIVVLVDAAAFLAVNPIGTVITCLLKGTAAGWISGLVFRALSRKSDVLATAAAAVVCPVVNTGIFLLGCVVFFLPTITAWGEAAGFTNVGTYMVVGFVGLNFVFEMLINVVLSPVIVRLLNIAKKQK